MNSSPALFAVLLAFLAASCRKIPPDEKLPRNVRPAKKHWEMAWPEEKPPAGIPSLNAAGCGACHTAIYEDWKSTAHAKAFVDLQFQAERKKDGLVLCANCHTPLLNQQPFKVKGYVDGDYHKPFKATNPSYDPGLEREGITCAVCHVRDGMIVGPRGTGLAPHPVRKDPAHFQTLCMQCHNVQDTVSKTLICSFNTGDDWKAGPYAAKGIDCIECHMPTDSRPLAAGGKVYPDSRMHTWPGMGIAKFIGDLSTVASQYRPGLIFKEKMDPRIRYGTRNEFGVYVTNANAGHELPTGDPERFILIRLAILKTDGTILAEKESRIGEIWQWSPEAKKLSDNSIKPEETRHVGIEFTPMSKGEDFVFRIEVSNHRISVDNAKSLKLGEEYLRSVVIYRASKKFSIY